MTRGNRAARYGWVAVVGVVLAAPAPAEDDITRALTTIKSVDREGKKNDSVGPAWRTLVAEGGPALLPTLAAIDDANPTAANWLRTAVDAIAEAEANASRPLPATKLEAFVKDTKNAPSARQLAYELLSKQDKSAPDRLLPGFLNDPNPDLRRDAIAAELDRLTKADPATAKPALERLFGFSRDKDQVDALVKKLGEAGVQVSVAEHFAFLTHWHLVGPFESEKGKALILSYPPEMATDLAATFPGKGGAKVGWKPYSTADKYGQMDLNKFLGKSMNAAAYARAVVNAESETPCQIRVGSPNAVQIFLNGKKLFEREEYHHGMNLDHHTGLGVLRKGENVILIKVCQNNQTDSWAQTWSFQARVCDATGGPLPGLTQVVLRGGQPVPLKLGESPEPDAILEGKK